MINKIEKIVQLADIHLPMLDKRHPEFRVVFENTKLKLEEEKPELIVVNGDLFHDKLKISNEVMVLAKEFLLMLSLIAPVVVVRGNHDFLLSHKDIKMDCITALLALGHYPRVTYYNQTGFFVFHNLIFVVWHHGDHYSPWNQLNLKQEDRETNFHGQEIDDLVKEFQNIEGIKKEGYTFINLFHDPIRDSKTDVGFKMDSDKYLPISAFKPEHSLLFAGDIHRRSLWNKEGEMVL